MPVPLYNLPSQVCTGLVTTALSSSVCSVTHSAATPVVSSTPFAPHLNVMPTEPLRKWCRLDLSEDRRQMLAAFKEVWVARKHLSQRLLECLSPLAAVSAVSLSAAPTSGHLFLLLVLGL